MATRAVGEEREANRTGATGTAPVLTQAQKDATIQKWAEWILKQRQAARNARTAGTRTRDDSD